MQRREFFTLMAVVAAWPVVVNGQQSAMPTVGFLHNATLDARRAVSVEEFLRGLAEAGYIVGKNVAIEYRWAENLNDRLLPLAMDLVRSGVTVIATPGSTASALAAQAATKTIPVVFLMGADPVEIGLVASFNRPGGNVTGIALLNVGLVAKRLELLHQLVPAATRIAYLRNPSNTKLAEAETKEAQAAAQRIGIGLTILDATNIAEIEREISVFADPIQALLIGADPMFFTAIDELVKLTARRRIPAIAHWREFTTAGGLINYGPSFPKAYRSAGILTGRILRGEKPDDLPVQQATKIEFVVNLASARSLGLIIPSNLLAFADETIE